MTYTLIHGNCLEAMDEISSGSVDLVLTDPPYGTTACSWDTIIPFEPMWEQIKRVRKPRAAVVLFGSEPFSSLLRVSNLGEYKYDHIAPKSMKTGFVHAKNKPLKAHDNISVFSAGVTIHKGQSENRMTYNPQFADGKPYKKKQTSVGINRFLHAPSKSNIDFVGNVNINDGYRYPDMILPKFKQHNHVLHPTQKPVALLRYLIRTYTNAGDTVLDFTMGSGSTGEAAILEGRNFIGIDNGHCEKEGLYHGWRWVDVARDRIANAANEFTLTAKEKASGQMALWGGD